MQVKGEIWCGGAEQRLGHTRGTLLPHVILRLCIDRGRRRRRRRMKDQVCQRGRRRTKWKPSFHLILLFFALLLHLSLLSYFPGNRVVMKTSGSILPNSQSPTSLSFISASIYFEPSPKISQSIYRGYMTSLETGYGISRSSAQSTEP